MKATYNRAKLAEAISKAGVKRGDAVFSHSNVGYFGFPEEGETAAAIFETILGAFQDVLGPEGTLVVPTFSYSFCKRQPFDPQKTPSTCGLFTEMVRTHPAAVRSHEPIFSVSAIGARADELTRKVPPECFGAGSFWDRFRLADGIFCNLNFDAAATYLHYVERCLNVPYRYDKLFTGNLVVGGQARKTGAVFFCRDETNPDTYPVFEPFHTLALQRGLARTEAVGRGAVVAIRAQDTSLLVEEELRSNPWLLTLAGKEGRVPAERSRKRFGVSLPENATMDEMIQGVWRLPRDIVSDGYDEAMEALSGQVPMTIHSYPTGMSAWTWIVPEKWSCEEGYLETLDGKRLFSYQDNPLHVVSYSLPFEGEVSREELLGHLHVHASKSDAVPFGFKYYDRDWGLCCTKDMRDSLADAKYRVVIRSTFSQGALKVGEVVIPGESDESIVLCAHLCHPAMVNDGLSGVVVGIDVMRKLLSQPRRHYTYRLLLLPETIGSISYLSQNEALIPKMKGGLFLEMLGLDTPHSLQMSFAGTTEVDRCFRHAMQQMDPHGWTGKFRSIIGNDERQFNAPGVRVPMLSLSRVYPTASAKWPFPEYHSHLDGPALCATRRLEESRDLVLRMIDTLERNQAPVNLFKGEAFCSRYGVHIDYYTNPKGHKALFDIMYLIDGTRTIADIADATAQDFSTVDDVVEELRRHGLVSFGAGT